MPPTGLSLVWNSNCDRAMVCLGIMSRHGAEESVELTLSILEKSKANVALQNTRSKRSLTRK